MSNMGLNFGKKSAEQYLAETTKKVMSRYDGYAIKLEQKDANLSLDAHQIKQQYQLPYQPEEIKSDLYNIGIKGITERLKTNSYKPTTTNTQQQSSNFAYGGKIYAQDGFNFSTWQGDKVIKGRNKADYTPEDLQSIASYYFPNKKYTSNKELQQDILDYLGEDYNKYVIPTPVGTKTRLNPTQSLVDDKFGDDWSLAIAKMKEGIIQPISPLGLQKMNATTNSNFNLPSDIVSNSILNKSRANSHVPLEEDEESTTTSTPGQNNQNKTSWMDKLKYGLRESLPYLRNMMLMNEGIINPVLQQKSYQNPYDNFNTDYSIQSALNDSDRNTLTAMADERGNPSVRSARLAQIAANAIAAKAPLYTQKYNQEQQLQNQKTIGQSQYLNQWEDVNRGLHKDFEHEVLQTREIQRQQRAMAIDNMMNIYLRKAEENQALKLSLMNTNWDWNKYKQELVNNPEKAKAQFNYLQTMYKMQGGKEDLSKLAPPGYELEQSYKLVKKKSP